jgi:hypothetical protein
VSPNFAPAPRLTFKNKKKKMIGRKKEGEMANSRTELPKHKTGKIPLHTSTLPPRLGGLLAPARSFERFESS